LDIHTHEKLLIIKDDPEDNKGIQIRESRKQKLMHSIQKQKEPVGGDKGKSMVNYPTRSKTRATNKFRLNLKSLFNPSLKEENVIVIDDDTT
jgi:hypothetical protein